MQQGAFISGKAGGSARLSIPPPCCLKTYVCPAKTAGHSHSVTLPQTLFPQPPLRPNLEQPCLKPLTVKMRGHFCEEHSGRLEVLVKGKLGRYCQVCYTVHELSHFVGSAKTCEKWLARRRMQRAARRRGRAATGQGKQEHEQDQEQEQEREQEQALCALCKKNQANETSGARRRACLSCITSSATARLSSAGVGRRKLDPSLKAPGFKRFFLFKPNEETTAFNLNLVSELAPLRRGPPARKPVQRHQVQHGDSVGL